MAKQPKYGMRAWDELAEWFEGDGEPTNPNKWIDENIKPSLSVRDMPLDDNGGSYSVMDGEVTQAPTSQDKLATLTEAEPNVQWDILNQSPEVAQTDTDPSTANILNEVQATIAQQMGAEAPKVEKIDDQSSKGDARYYTEEAPVKVTPNDVNTNLYEFVKGHEGFTPVAQQDYKQVSYGYGMKAGEVGDTISEPEAFRAMSTRLDKDKATVVARLKKLGLDANENQINALTSFTYNLGVGGLNQVTQGGRSLEEIAAKMTEYNKAGGKVSDGLISRRASEVALFNTPINADVATDTMSEGTPEAQAAVEATITVLDNAKGSDTTTEVIVTKAEQNIAALKDQVDAGLLSEKEATARAYDSINKIQQQKSNSNFFESNKGAIVQGLLTFAGAKLMGANSQDAMAAGILGAIGHEETVRQDRADDYTDAAEMRKNGISMDAIVASTGRSKYEIQAAIGEFDEVRNSKEFQLYSRTRDAMVGKKLSPTYINAALKQQFPQLHKIAITQDAIATVGTEGGTGTERIIDRTQDAVVIYRKYEDELLKKYKGDTLNQIVNEITPAERQQLVRKNQDIEIVTSNRTPYGQILTATGKSQIAVGEVAQKTAIADMQAISPDADRQLWLNIEETRQNMETGPLSSAMTFLDKYMTGDAFNSKEATKAYNQLGQLEKQMIIRVVQHFKPVSQGNIVIAQDMAAISPMYQEEFNEVSLDNVQKLIATDGVKAIRQAKDANIKYGAGYEGDADPTTFGGGYEFYESPMVQNKFPELYGLGGNTTNTPVTTVTFQ